MAVLQPPGRSLERGTRTFVIHFVEICVVMLFGGALLSAIAFAGAIQLGMADPLRQLGGLSSVVIGCSLALSILASVRLRGVAWYPALELAGAPLAVGFVLIDAYLLGILSSDGLPAIQVALACPTVLAVMLSRKSLWTSGDALAGLSADA